MNYGYFDEKNKEYVITRPDTPSAWANYLGSPEYGAIISNNAGGYSFKKSGANGRILRYRFNSNDEPGRYIYIKDKTTNEFWTNSWAPVCKPNNSVCRHGTAYSVISSDYKKIKTETTYFVPLNAICELWVVKVQNNDDVDRTLGITGYCEFTNDPNYEQDTVNLQYSLFITRSEFENNAIIQYSDKKDEQCYFALANEKVSGYCGDRDKFIGHYKTLGNPDGIAKGLKGEMNYCGNTCGALEATITLNPNEEKTLVFIVGKTKKDAIAKTIKEYSDANYCYEKLAELKNYWHSKLNNLAVKTPDEGFNNMINVWNAYNCFITFTWSRAASFQYCGLRNGLGYRDTVQDIQGIIHLDPKMAKERLVFMLSAQVTNGAGLPLVKFNHNAGFENTPDDPEYVKETGHPSYRADDALWLFPTVDKYICESGDLAFLDEEIYYANGQRKATTYEHLKQAIEFSINNSGVHGMPAGLHADWNDCLRLGKKGESTFVAFQLYYAIKIIKEYAIMKNDSAYIAYLDKLMASLDISLSDCWDKDRFIRGYRETGEIIGAKKDKEASMWLNPQSWSVISGYATEEQAIKALDSVERELNTPYGAMVMYPPYQKHAFDGALMQCYLPTIKENAGIFSQPQGWLILAEAKAGRGNKAYQYFKEASPATYNDNAELREMEPYVYGQFTEGKDSPYAGRSHVHWLTGTASTVMVGITEGILGLKPRPEGIVIDPSIPSEWKSLSMKKYFRGKWLNITVENPNGNEHGIKQVLVNDKPIEGLLIKDEALVSENNIVIKM